MKNYSKGFVLIETLIVTVFLMGIFTFLFTNVVPLSARYERTRNYDDVSTVYAVDEIRKMIKNDARYDIITAEINNLSVVHRDITKCTNYTNTSYCNALLPAIGVDHLGTNQVIITKYELTQIKNKIRDNNLFLNDPKTSDLAEYILQLPTYTDKDISDGFRIIIRRTVVENGREVVKFANLELFK